MSLVFPNEMAATSTNTALAKGAFWFGLVFLSATFASVALIAADRSTDGAIAVLSPLVLIAAASCLAVTPAATRWSVIAAVAALTLVGNTLFVSLLIPRLDSAVPSDMVLLTLPKIAIVMTGVVIGRYRSGVASIIVAYLIAEAPVAFVSVTSGSEPRVDLALTVFTAVLLVIRVSLLVTRKRTRASQPALSCAGEAERSDALLKRRQRDASALIQNTVLSDLETLAATTPGPLSTAVRDQITRNLRVVTTPTATALARSVGTESVANDTYGRLDAAITRARRLGLVVTVNGDTGALDFLDTATASALGRTVSQCLANVHAHSGVNDAEVSVVTTETEICVMVLDSGSGGATSPGAAEREIRESLGHLLSSVGGRVDLWIAPGSGTAVSLTVPRP